MSAYYNEIDPYAAQWLRNLIKAGHIAPGFVDERSIEDVTADDLKEFTQCHFFAGIGVWSFALRKAGWPDDRRVWTMSCPCQPFSAAGAGAGFDDERHLWPVGFQLAIQSQPPVIFGEQVSSKAVEPWVDLVQADLEALGYAFGCIAFPSAGVGAPHIRDRAYWVAHADGEPGRQGGQIDGRRYPGSDAQSRAGLGGSLLPVGLDDANDARSQGHAGHGGAAGRQGPDGPVTASGVSGGMADADGRLQSRSESRGGIEIASTQWAQGAETSSGRSGDQRPGPVNGHWRDADWLFCRDGKWRPVEPGTSPLAHGAASRVGRLRAYGNAVNAEAATQFILAYLDTEQSS